MRPAPGVLEGRPRAQPERFVRKPPVPPKLLAAAWINKSKEVSALQLQIGSPYPTPKN